MTHSLLPIESIARKLKLPEAYFEPIGRYSAKLRLMPSLPKVSRAMTIDVNAKGEIVGI